MPRFAANLAYLFTDRPLLERFAAAAAAASRRSNCNFPMTCRPQRCKRAIERNNLTHARPQYAAGRARGRIRLLRRARPRARLGCAVPPRRSIMSTAVGASAIHCLAGKVEPEQRPAAERSFIDNLRRAADLAGGKNITLLIEPINARDRPDYFLNRVEHAADIIAKVGRPNVRHPVRFLSCADRRRRSDHRLREAPAADRPFAMRRGALAARAGRGRDQLSGVFAALDRLGYQGWIGAEYRPRGRTEDGLGWSATAMPSRQPR